MQPDELVEAIRAALDELELRANDCIAEVGGHVAGGPFEDGSGVADLDAFPSYPYGSQERELAYMKAVQPREMLRRVAADRRVLARHQPALADLSVDFDDTVSVTVCRSGSWYEDGDSVHVARIVRWPCGDVRDLADRYGIEVEENRDG